MNEEVKLPLDLLNPIPLLDSTIEALRNAILNGRFQAGERLNEPTLTAQLGISRTTFREALRQLEQEGLLVRIPYRGTFVRKFSHEEIRDLNNLRGILEGYAAELIIENNQFDPDNLSPLYEIVEEMEEINPETETDKVNHLHIRFHYTLINIANNKLLSEIWTGLAQQFWVALRVSHLSHVAIGEASTFAGAHREVVDAIATGDANQVRQKLRDHVSISSMELSKASAPNSTRNAF